MSTAVKKARTGDLSAYKESFATMMQNDYFKIHLYYFKDPGKSHIQIIIN